MDGFLATVVSSVLKPVVDQCAAIGFAKAKQIASANIVQTRFSHLLREHRVTCAELLAFVPADWGWMVKTTKTVEDAANNLNYAKIEWLAAKFGVQTKWLLGSEPTIYETIFGYKQLPSLVEQLAEQQMFGWGARVTAFVDHATFSGDEFSSASNLVLVFSMPFNEGEHDGALRHVVCGDVWPWRYDRSRLEVKAIARWMFQQCRISTRVAPVTSDQLHRISQGELIPDRLVRLVNNDSLYLEDFALMESESCIAREPEEAVVVAEYLNEQLGHMSLPVLQAGN